MKNKKDVIEKLLMIREGGTSKLQIITDFDRTVSKHHHNGNITKSSYCKYGFQLSSCVIFTL